MLQAELPGPRRAALHRQVALALEALHAGHLPVVVPALAYHYGEAAALHGEKQAVRYARWAGDLARAAAAFSDAAGHYEKGLRALALAPPNPRQRAVLGVCLGYALLSAGRGARARAVLEEAAAIARSAGEDQLFGVAALGIADFFALRADDLEAIAMLREALVRLGPDASFLQIRVRAALAALLTGAPAHREEAMALAAQAEAGARALGGNRALAAALLAQANLERTSPSGSPERRAALATEAAETVRGAGEGNLEILASLVRHGAFLEMGDPVRADRELAQLERHVARLHFPYWRNVVPYMQAGRAMLEGRFDEAEPLAMAAFGAVDALDTPHPLLHIAVCGAVRFEQDRGAELLALLETVLEPSLSPHADTAPYQVARLLGLVEAGRHAEARHELESLLKAGFASLVGILDWVFVLTLAAVAVSELGHERAARALYPLLEPCAGTWAVVGNGRYCAGPVAFHLGTLALTFGEPDTAARHLERALERVETLPSPPWRAYVLATLSRVPPQRGSADARRRARGFAREAAALAKDLGMKRLLRKLGETMPGAGG